MQFFQIISQYAGGILDVPWPDFYSQFARKFDVFNLNVLSIASSACIVTTSFYDKLLAMTVGPIVLAFLIFGYYSFHKVRLLALEADRDGNGHLDWDEIRTALRYYFLRIVSEPEYVDVVVDEDSGQDKEDKTEEEDDENNRAPTETEMMRIKHNVMVSIDLDDENNRAPTETEMMRTKHNAMVCIDLDDANVRPVTSLQQPRPTSSRIVRRVKEHPHRQRIASQMVDLEQTCTSLFLALTYMVGAGASPLTLSFPSRIEF